MKNRLLLILLTVALVVSLVGVAACAEEEEPPPEEWQWPDKLIILSMTSASSSYARDMAYGVLLEEDTGMKVRVVGEDNFVLRYQWMKLGRFFWTSMDNHTMIDMLEGIGEFASRDGGPWQIRIAYASGVPGCGGPCVRGDSGLKTPYDIKPGMKVSEITMAPAMRRMMEAVLAWGQVDPDDVVWIPASTPDMCAVHLMDGRVDITFGNSGMPIYYEVEASPHGLGWIELNGEEDPEGLARFSELIPNAVTAPNDSGVPSSIGVHMFCDIGTKVTGAGVDPELLYQMVKWMDENFDRYKDAHPSLPGMSMEMLMTVIERSFVPVHEATIRYLKELGLWTDAHEARNQANIELMTRWCQAWETAIDMADEEGISVDVKNEEWLELWENYKKDLPRFKVFPGLD